MLILNKRPTCEKLLNSNIILTKVEELFSETLADTKSILLSTIRCSKNLMKLSDRLPLPKYDVNKVAKTEQEIDKSNSEHILPQLFNNQKTIEANNDKSLSLMPPNHHKNSGNL